VGRLSKRLLSAACIRLVAGECETGRWVRGSREKGVWCFRVTHPSAQLHAEDADLADPVRHDVESTGRRVWVSAFRWFLVSRDEEPGPWHSVVAAMLSPDGPTLRRGRGVC
jgi:hypothetical protein